jgi:Predicted esterase
VVPPVASPRPAPPWTWWLKALPPGHGPPWPWWARRSGFYASWVARHTGCPSVLLNPAVHPARDLARHIGEQTAWHDPAERFFFLPEYIAELQALSAEHTLPVGREMAIIAKGDEVLDWQEMVARYPAAQQTLLEGGDHALSDFEDHLPAVAQFLQLA